MTGGTGMLDITAASTAKATLWNEHRRLTWDEVCGVMDPRSRERQASKDGYCFVPGKLVRDRRLAGEVASISMLVADIDIGVSVETVEKILRASGVTWVLTSTWSHGRSEVRRTMTGRLWSAMQDAFGGRDQAGRLWLRAHYCNAVADTLRSVSTNPRGNNVEVVFHLSRPVPRLRVGVPMAVPWTPAGGPGESAAKQWRELYLAAWDGLGLGWAIDGSCGDVARLFYSGRMPGAARVPAVFVRSADGLLWVQLAQAVAPRPGGVPVLEAAVLAARAEAVAQLEKVTLSVGEAGRKRRQRGVEWRPWVVNRIRGLEATPVDLEQWHRANAHELKLPDLVAHHRPDMLDDRPDAGAHVHIVCPREVMHTTDGHGSTYAVNGSGWMPAGAKGRQRGFMFCNHDHCRGVSHGQWLDHLLCAGMITWGDLDEAEARVAAAKGAAARRDLVEVAAGGGGAQGVGGDADGDGGDAGGHGAGVGAAGGAGSGGSGGHDSWAEVIEAGRKAAAREDDAAAAEKQFPATQRFMLTPGGRFFDLWAGGAEAREPQALAFTVAVLAGQYGFSARSGDALSRWVEWDRTRRALGLPPCVAAGVTYLPGGGARVPGAGSGAWLVNLWRPGPVPWAHGRVPDDEPVVVAFKRLVHNITDDYRNEAAALWWAADMLVRVGKPRITWGPVFYGVQGCGKSTYVEFLCELVGRHNAVVLTLEEFTKSNENTHFAAQLTVIDEANSHGTGKDGRSRANRLYDAVQPYYTATTLRLVQKYMTAQNIPLFGRIAILTNAADAAAPPHDDRRMLTVPARGGVLGDALAAELYALMRDKVAISKLARWLMDEYEALGAVHGFSPFRCPTQDVPSEFKAELVRDGLTQCADVARAWVESAEGAGRTVLTFAEVVDGVRARLRMEPGMRPAHQDVAEGIMVAGWTLAARWAEGGRGGARHRLYLRNSEINKKGFGNIKPAELGLRWLVERAKVEGGG